MSEFNITIQRGVLLGRRHGHDGRRLRGRRHMHGGTRDAPTDTGRINRLPSARKRRMPHERRDERGTKASTREGGESGIGHWRRRG